MCPSHQQYPVLCPINILQILFILSILQMLSIFSSVSLFAIFSFASISIVRPYLHFYHQELLVIKFFFFSTISKIDSSYVSEFFLWSLGKKSVRDPCRSIPHF
eukprot:Gregarina_sp_Poly_1__10483@NODE_766_length_6375_cov_28_411382_g563_i0_p7_GENE_NODE_766_length_6375_cov_28_411382_g563_i0NODE_766_length_6375_cov_28_411382_g563_i0_p7_ORF_typecomplete_len103_score6_65MCLC/PF05934_11/0_58_NODE_766_length_6375_cov_28_411382_g563_i056345942